MLSFEQLTAKGARIAVVGLGYVGLPLAVALAEHFDVLGFDRSARRVAELSGGHDRTGEVDGTRLQASALRYTTEEAALRGCGLIIIAVPTPIDDHRRPDLTPVVSASEAVGRNLTPGTVVTYESTVYPGLTEEVCVPILERCSGLSCGEGFSVGYSPERVNPGDAAHGLAGIVKVVSGMNEPTRELLAQVYGTVVPAGIHKASSIRVAEAAKVIENTQRDLNIALMNELALLFDRMGLDTLEVLQAAGTKWNFVPFRPGLVGGHCIGVDPYYLTYKAEGLGFHPQVILAGRRINDSMGVFVADKTVRLMVAGGVCLPQARVGVLGMTFKENVRDLRNSRVADIVAELKVFCGEVLVHDPLADAQEAQEEYGLTLRRLDELRDLDALVLAVPHRAFAGLTAQALKAMFRLGSTPILADVRGLLDPAPLRAAGFVTWRL